MFQYDVVLTLKRRRVPAGCKQLNNIFHPQGTYTVFNARAVALSGKDIIVKV